MATDTVSILDGSTFVVSDRRGDMDATPTDTHGLFFMDTRFLSKWVLTVNGLRPNVLSTDDLQYFSSQFFLVPTTGTMYVDSPLSVIRKRAVGRGFHEDLKILNYGAKPLDLDVRIDVDADFADLFEVKDKLQKKGQAYRRVEDSRLVLGYRREQFVRETRISSSPGGQIDEQGIRFRFRLEPHEEWNATFEVVTSRVGRYKVADDPKYSTSGDRPKPDMGLNLEEWIGNAPKLRATWPSLERIYRRSLVDLAALRFSSLLIPGASLPAAGLPWFMALFGRDSLITSLQSLPYEPELAKTTLLTLGMRQGTIIDDFRDEEPGKILHEARLGEMTAFEERPHSPYFGTADATPLFLVLLDEYERWTGDSELVRNLEQEARAALNWIDEYGDRDGDGYVEYERRNTETGLENQCWKDSWDSIKFRDGTLASLPRATCEIQGYVYDAKMRCARLAREVWEDHELAEKLEQQAAELKRRFNEDFWLEDRMFFALALDGEKRKVDSLTSNIGHLLWSGIADEAKADACVQHLMGPALFSGWGVRTMASTEGAYNPIGYHVGTVWPHDNSIIAWGLRRYGYAEAAARITMGILEAATFFDSRLPEAFAGYDRTETWFPVEYPTACSPQAWSTAAPLLLIRCMLGMEPVGNKLLVDPAVPQPIGQVELLDIQGRWGHVDAFGRGRVEVSASAAAQPVLSAAPRVHPPFADKAVLAEGK
jgi:glycogen debranching enzyme